MPATKFEPSQLHRPSRDTAWFPPLGRVSGESMLGGVMRRTHWRQLAPPRHPSRSQFDSGTAETGLRMMLTWPMTSQRQRQNLKRGGIAGTAATAARARDGKAALAAEAQRLADTASADPWAAYGDLHATMTRHMLKLLRNEERQGIKPSRDVTDRLREYRQTTEALTAYASARATETEAEGFFAELDERMAAALERMPNGPEPPVDVTAGWP